MEIIIDKCRNRCPFYSSNMDGMFCGHPYWDDKKPYDNMIITQSNSVDGKIPLKCPLRIEELNIKYKLKL